MENKNKVEPIYQASENAVISCMINSANAIPKVIEILKPEMFADPINRKICETIFKLWNESKSVDIVNLSDAINNQSVTNHILEIAKLLPSAQRVEEYAKNVLNAYNLRQLNTKAKEIAGKQYNLNSDSIKEIESAGQEILDISQSQLQTGYVSIGRLAGKAEETIRSAKEKGYQEVSGIPSGYVELDHYTGGFQKSDLIIIAARPSMGKTALSLSIARNIAMQKQIPVAYFSLEMSAEQLSMRLISAEVKIPQQNIKTGRITDTELTQIVNTVNEWKNIPLYIDQTPSLSIFEFKAKCRRLIAEQKIQIAMIDYLQLMRSKADSRELEVSSISRQLKAFAKEFDIPIIAMAQLNRNVEGRPDKRPILSDLRESGAIEQDADIVMFINRPEVYKIMTYEDDGVPTEGTAEIIIAKHRNGAIGDIRLAFIKELARFENLAINVDYINEPTVNYPNMEDEPF